MGNCRLTVLSIAAIVLVVGCAEKPPGPPGEGPPGAIAEVERLKTLGRHVEADAYALELGIEIDPGRFELPESYEETMDGGDDPLTPGCACCYDDRACTVIQGRSVDECFPGGDGGDDLSENIAGTQCTLGEACAERKRYSCDRVLPGSVCRLQDVTCCGVATTSGFCFLDIT